MATALKTRDIPGRQATVDAKKAAKARQQARKTDFAGKTFEQLTGPQKDALLKQLAVQAKLIEDSDD